jgi:SulP family sulfate permease
VPGVVVMGFQAPLSFLNADDFRRDVMDAISARKMNLLVLEASSIVEMDFTAAEVLSQVIAKVRATGRDFAVARLESVRAKSAFDRFGVTECLGPGHLFQSVDEAIRNLIDQPGVRERGLARGASESAGKDAEGVGPL